VSHIMLLIKKIPTVKTVENRQLTEKKRNYFQRQMIFLAFGR
jgi:hypothetical protein